MAGGCEICQSVQGWLAKRHPVGLEFAAAEQHPDRDLLRITYEDGDYEVEGIAAIARALEHLHLGWGVVGFLMRLPVVRGDCRY